MSNKQECETSVYEINVKYANGFIDIQHEYLCKASSRIQEGSSIISDSTSAKLFFTESVSVKLDIDACLEKINKEETIQLVKEDEGVKERLDLFKGMCSALIELCKATEKVYDVYARNQYGLK